MAELREELSEIILQTISSVDYDTRYETNRSWNGTEVVENVVSIKFCCTIPMYGMTEEQKRLFGQFEMWIQRGREKLDVGKYKGVIPIRYDRVMSESTFEPVIRIEFSCDYIAGEEDLPPAHAPVHAPVHAHVHAHVEPKKKDHFEKDLFEV